MPWNWQLPNWPNFQYDNNLITPKEKEFLLGSGGAFAFLQSIDRPEYNQFVVEILSSEGLQSSKIEGEMLDRESLQSSIRQHFGLNKAKKQLNRESGMAKLLCNVYETFGQPLTHSMLYQWHHDVLGEASHTSDLGRYRTHEEPMQIVSHRYGSTKVFFEAPPSGQVLKEMDYFIGCYNRSLPSEGILAKAAIAHLYFESIHPFEDGNGRIGRALVEKKLSQGIGQPVLIAISKVLEKRKKEYYLALERCNKTLEVNHWVDFFSDVILQAQKESLDLLYFLIEKAKMLTRLAGQLNSRQEKALLRLFEQGLEGFKGGLSAEKYIAITKTSRASATRDLTDLLEKGVLIKTGELRHTRYWLNLPKKEG